MDVERRPGEKRAAQNGSKPKAFQHICFLSCQGLKIWTEQFEFCLQRLVEGMK
jgi:hypothetical protein